MTTRWILPVLALLALRASAEELTLEQAIELGLKNNRTLANASLEVQKAGYQIEVARTYRLPTFQFNVLEAQFLNPVSFEFPAGAWGVYPSTGPIPATNSEIPLPRHPFTLVTGSVTQPLSELSRIRTGIRLSELERESAQARLEISRQAVVSEVRKLYYGILQSESAVIANESAAKTLRELDRVTADSVAKQVALKSDALEVKARLAKSEYEAAELLHSLAEQKEQLNDLMGRDARTEFTVRTLPEPSMAPVDLTAARAHALASRPEIHEAELRIREAEADREMKHAEFRPAVDLTMQYMSPFQISLLPKNILAAGVQFKWDVFDWGRRKNELAVKDVTIAQAKNALLTTQSQVLIEVEGRYRTVEESRRMLQVVQVAQEAARERLRIAQDRHAAESALLKDLLEAQSSLAETDYQYQQAMSSYMTARADFDRAAANQ